MVIKYLEDRESKLKKKSQEVHSQLEMALDNASNITQTDKSVCEKSLRSAALEVKSSLTSKYTEIDLMVARISQSIHDLWTSLENLSKGQESRNLDLTPIVINSKLSSLSKNDLLDLHKLRASLNRFSQCYNTTLNSWSKSDETSRLVSNLSTIKEEIRRTITSIEADVEKLEPGKDILARKVLMTRKEVLDLPSVQERRKWYIKRLATMLRPLSSLRISFDCTKTRVKNNDSNSGDSLSFNSPFNHSKHRGSFQPADISTLFYIPPSAPDNPILSPLREEWS